MWCLAYFEHFLTDVVINLIVHSVVSRKGTPTGSHGWVIEELLMWKWMSIPGAVFVCIGRDESAASAPHPCTWWWWQGTTFCWITSKVPIQALYTITSIHIHISVIPWKSFCESFYDLLTEPDVGNWLSMILWSLLYSINSFRFTLDSIWDSGSEVHFMYSETPVKCEHNFSVPFVSYTLLENAKCGHLCPGPKVFTSQRHVSLNIIS